MAKQQDFAYHLTNYLTVYLSGTKDFSINTIYSYRDTFKLLLKYCEDELHLSAGKLRLHISHKYEDLDAAQKVADYIMDYGIDVYLDDCDHNLQKAVAANNSEGIVACIENGLNWSTHILVLITENTRMSWWVPYETGYAKKGGKGIASLLLKEADEFPDYLKIETALNGFTDLTKFLDTLSVSVTMMEAASLKKMRYSNFLNSV